MGATQRGTLALFVEPTANQGRQLLLGETAVGSLSITTQPNAILAGCHMHLLIIISGAAATGTVTIVGKKNDATTAVTETTPTIAAATVTKPQTQYCTSATYNTIDASGITVTGLTNATITIYGIYQGTKLVPCTFETKEKFDYLDPKDQRGLMYGTTRLTQQVKHTTLDKFDIESFYPDTDLWYGFAVWNNTPTVVTIPAVPTTKMAATAVTSAPFSLTTQPVGPGEMLQLVVTATTTYGTIGITGVNTQGQTVTETVVAYAGAGTYYTTNIYSSVGATAVTITGLTGGSLAINGIFGTQWTFKIGAATVNALTFGMFSGTDSSVYPYGLVDSADLEMDASKDIKLTCKCTTQDMIPLGNRSTTPLSTSRLPTLGQPFDMPVSGWQSFAYIDALSGTAFTTPYNDLQTFKLTVPTAWKPTFTATGSQLYSRAYQDGSDIKVKFDALIDFTDLNQYEQWRQNVKQLIGVKFIDKQNGYMGNIGGVLYHKSWQLTLPAKYDTFERDRSKEKVEAKVTGLCEYEPSLGYAAQLTIINQCPPNYQAT
jgi:hypothetical protein